MAVGCLWMSRPGFDIISGFDERAAPSGNFGAPYGVGSGKKGGTRTKDLIFQIVNRRYG